MARRWPVAMRCGALAGGRTTNKGREEKKKGRARRREACGEEAKGFLSLARALSILRLAGVVALPVRGTWRRCNHPYGRCSHRHQAPCERTSIALGDSPRCPVAVPRPNRSLLRHLSAQSGSYSYVFGHYYHKPPSAQHQVYIYGKFTVSCRAWNGGVTGHSLDP